MTKRGFPLILPLVDEKAVIDIVVFARSPVLGQVKRRLAAAIGPRAALAVYRKLLRHTLCSVVEACDLRPDFRPVLYHLGPVPTADIPRGFPIDTVPQPFATMNENLAALFEEPARHNRTGIVVLGADHPMLLAEDIVAMADLLRRHQVAIGPAEDGGFWSLATVLPLRDVMLDLPLGCAETGRALINALCRLGQSAGIGPTLLDIDTVDDLARCEELASYQARRMPCQSLRQ